MEDAYVMQLPDRMFRELYLCFCGYAKCKPLHSFGPAVRPNYILHYILEGKGVYQINGDTYELCAGQGFLIPPDVQTFYRADSEAPWRYLWVGFNGANVREYLKNAGLAGAEPVFTCGNGERLKEIVLEMLRRNTFGPHNEFKLQSLLLDFFSVLAQTAASITDTEKRTDKSNLYVKKAVEFIQNNYSNPIGVNDVAGYTAVSRSYLYRLFREATGKSPQEYLTAFRITRARELLSFTELSIESVALSCGYRDPLVFAKTFKNKTGKAPSEYRTAHHKTRVNENSHRVKTLDDN